MSAPVELSVPGKTFLVGEYLALRGGPSLIATTGPRFLLKTKLLSQNTPISPTVFPEKSPAARLIARHPDLLGDYCFEFLDPHSGRGGLGASSAQFALVYAALNAVTNANLISWPELLAEYRECAWDGTGTAPSGADLVAQLSGQVTVYDGLSQMARSSEWPFLNLAFTLLHTGKKLATHEHLRNVKKDQAEDHISLLEISQRAIAAFDSSDELAFICAVSDYANALQSLGLVAAHTQELLNELHAANISVLAAKGCGAMGADVVLVLHPLRSQSAVFDWAKARGIELCGSQNDLTDGLRAN